MKYAKKISIDFDVEIGKKLTQHPVVAKHVLDKYGDAIGEYQGERVVIRYMPKKYTNQLKAFIPEKAKKHLISVNLTEIRLLAPHIHLREQCVMNFYLHTNGEVTSFWEGEIERDDNWTLDNGNGYMIVNSKSLKFSESYTAQPGDCWLLNTGQPHSVSYPDDDRTGMFVYEAKNVHEPRWLVQAYFNAPFEQIAEYFEN